MCHVALIFFWNLENDHSCVVMQWLYLRCTNFLWRSETCSRMCHDTAWCTDAFWESGKCPQMRHAAVALLGVWKSSLVRHHSLIFFWYPRNLHSCGALIGYGFRHWGFGILDFGGSRNVPLGNSVTAPRVQRLEWPCADFKWANSVL